METVNTETSIDTTKFDWETYFEKGKASLKKELEGNSEMWNNWTKIDKRYVLIFHLMVVENDIDNNLSGRVTAHLDCHASSDNLEDLKLLWKSRFVQERYASTRQHFIIDTKEKKVIEFVSVCM